MRNDKCCKISDKGIIAPKLIRRPLRKVMNEEAPEKLEAKNQYQRQEGMMAYIVELAYSGEFRVFVDELERSLELALDTAAIHAAFGLWRAFISIAFYDCS